MPNGREGCVGRPPQSSGPSLGSPDESEPFMPALVTVLDNDGTVLAQMTPGVAARHAPNHVPTHDGRLAPPALAAQLHAAHEARLAAAADAALANAKGDRVAFWEAVHTMDEPAGIRSSLA